MTARRSVSTLLIIAACAALFGAWMYAGIHPPSVQTPPPPTYAGAIPVRAGLPFALHDGGINAVCVVDHSAYAMPPLFQSGR